jgi:ABC-2 type transport system ATP-binding protein
MHPEIPRVSGWEWVSFLVQQHGFGRREARQRAEDALEQVGMTAAMHRPINTYSLGMRQRTKLAQAIAHDPELLILDEPFNGLDPVARHEMSDLLRSWSEKGRSLIVASHVLHEVEAINPAFLLLSNGRLLASGSAREVRSLLTEIPSTIRIRASNARRLAAALVELPETDSVTLGHDEQELSVSTRSPSSLYAHLPDIGAAAGSLILEISSSDHSLQQLFTTLMHIHRGLSRTRKMQVH